jgi:hypothetical protein
MCGAPARRIWTRSFLRRKVASGPVARREPADDHAGGPSI